MTDKQPEALRLADRLSTGIIDREGADSLAAAAELRRLHEENEKLRAELAPLKTTAVKEQRAEAWKNRNLTKCDCDRNEYCVYCYPADFRPGGYWDQQEALAKAQGENND